MAIRWVDRVPTYANRVRIIPEDGSAPYYATMERADQPTVVGTPINAANLNAMQEAAGLTDHKYVYVATTGSDTTGDGSQSAPYATISRAIKDIPSNLNGYTARIHIAAGTYIEAVTIQNIGNGIIALTGNAGDAVTISGLVTVTNVQYMEIFNLSLSISNSFLNVVGSNVSVQTPFAASGGAYGIHASYFANLFFGNAVTINNTTTYAVVSTAGSKVYVNSLAGQGNPFTFRARDGSTIAFGADTSTAITGKYLTDTGGRVYSSAQTNAPVN